MASDGPGVLEGSLAHQFARSEQKKGHTYCFDYDCVDHLCVESNRITGTVYGSRSYGVDLYFSLQSGSIRVTDFACECPHFAKGNNCKHIWATILECDYLATSDPRWKKLLSGATTGDRLDELLARVAQQSPALASRSAPVHRDFLFGGAKQQQTRLSFVIEASQESLNLAVFKQKQKVNGDWGVAKRYKFSKQEIEWG